MEPILVIASAVVIGVGIAIVAAVASHKIEKKRTEQLAQIAADMGFSFESSSDAVHAMGLGRLPFFKRGHSRKTRNVLLKQVRGTEVVVLDHQYTTGHGKSRHTHKHTVAVFHPGEDSVFPDFEMRPETFFHKIGGLFGYHDINFMTHPRFSRRYLLRGADEAAIRAAFTPAVLDFFEQHSESWSVAAHLDWLMVLRGPEQRSFRISSEQGRVDPPAIAQFLADATKLYLLFAPPTAAEGTA